MKTYIFFTRRISEIGGAEQYLYNKSKYLESQGWRVFIFSARKGRILIPGFERYVDSIFPALAYAPECFSKREVRRMLNQIVEKVGDCGGDPCIVQSDAVNRAVWAEMTAERLRAKHLAFILQEEHGYDADIKHFLRFKYDRHELAGITASSVRQMLDDETLELRPDTRILASCQNVVEECEDRISPLLDPGAELTLGSIGRLEKPCVPAILNGFRTYFDDHPETKFNLVLIGGSADEKGILKIREEMATYKNVRLIITGNMYPIPLSLLKRIDVFVSTAGSARVSYKRQRPTIRVHPVSGEPDGVIGLDFDILKRSMYDTIPGLSIKDCLERALANEGNIVYNDQWDDSYYASMYAEFDRQLSFADTSIQQKYYDEKQLLRIRTAHIRRHFLHWLSGHLVGSRGQEYLRGR